MIKTVLGDITKLRVDAIVNAANERMLGGGGVDGAIHRAAGPKLLEACLRVAEVRPGVRCPTGEARITEAGDLPAGRVVHVAGPVYEGGCRGEAGALASCYRNALALAAAEGCKSVAFPSISTGAFGYPAEEAAEIAVRETRAFLETHPGVEVTFCLFNGPRDRIDMKALYDRVLARAADPRTPRAPTAPAKAAAARAAGSFPCGRESSRVRVMAVADVHGRFDLLDVSNADVVIVAGDVGPGRASGGAESDDWARGKALSDWFRRNSGVRFYVLPGNHDLFAKDHASRELVRGLWPGNVRLINDKGVVDESGLTIWGMPWNPIHVKPNGLPSGSKGGAFAADDAKIRRKCEKIARRFQKLDVLVTHAPPRVKGTAYGLEDWHLSPALAKMLPKINPKLLVCGHYHELDHRPQLVNGGNTVAVNVSLMPRGHGASRFKFKPRVIDVKVERAVELVMDENDDMVATPGLSEEDREWLKAVSVRIEKTVRGMNKLIDEGLAHKTAAKSTGRKFNAEVDADRLGRLAPLDGTGRVRKLVGVVGMIKASEAKGWTEKVLPELWFPGEKSRLYPGKMGDVRFGDYRFEG